MEHVDDGHRELRRGTVAGLVGPRGSPGGSWPPVVASPARHCLVGGLPGLLVEWLRVGRGREGRVVTVEWLAGPVGHGWTVVERRLPAAAIAPLD